MHGLISQRRASTTNWYAFDDLGSTRNLTNSSQTITDAYTYKAFGEIPASSGSTTNPFRYIGALNYYKDADSSLLLLGARYYAPQWGRFTTVDPLHDGRNSFPYPSRPTASADPSGLIAYVPSAQPSAPALPMMVHHMSYDFARHAWRYAVDRPCAWSTKRFDDCMDRAAAHGTECTVACMLFFAAWMELCLAIALVGCLNLGIGFGECFMKVMEECGIPAVEFLAHCTWHCALKQREAEADCYRRFWAPQPAACYVL